jgi:gliding motility-associated-like protein
MLAPQGSFTGYLWQDGSTQPVYKASGYGDYWVIVTDSNLCNSRSEISITSSCPGTLFVPNAFTPGGDGLNETFFATTRNIVKLHMRIYDRYGMLVYETHELNKGWDGTIEGKPATGDVYVFYIQYEGTDGESRAAGGNVTLLR